VRHLDVILSRAGASESMPARSGFDTQRHVLVVPGGGTGHPGAGDASAKFLAVANTLAGRGILTVFVGPTGGGSSNASLRCFSALPQADLAALMSGARLVITNGGSTLLQAIACGCACIGVPIAQDQPQRIERCVEAGVALAARLDAPSMAQTAEELLRDEPRRATLAQRATDLKLADGIEVALGALSHLMKSGEGA
jgi:UDP:flavonoid glycosyltransferase YjiC (YdhE family)